MRAVHQARKPLPGGAVEGTFRALGTRTPTGLERGEFYPLSARAHTPAFGPGSRSGRRASVGSAASEVPLPHLCFLFVFLVWLWYGFWLSARLRFWPPECLCFSESKEITKNYKRQVRTMAFRKQPYSSASRGLWKGGNNWISDFEYGAALHDSLNRHFHLFCLVL